jgi:hypothetical protein
MLKRAYKKASQTAASPEPTDVRFGMRGLLLTMAVVAIASAALGPFFRDLTPGRRGEVATAWCIALAVVLALVGYHARNRFRLERLAGRRLVSLPPRARMGFPVRPWLVVFGGLISISAGLYYLAMVARIFGSVRNNPAPLVEHVFPCLVSAALISMGIVTIWWNRTVQLRENGVLRGLKLLRWTHVTAHRWRDGDLFLEGVDQRHRDWQLTVVVGAKHRDDVSRLASRKLDGELESAQDDISHEGEAAEKRPLVKIRAGTDVTMRGMTSAIAVYVLAVIFLAARPWGRPPTAFMGGIGIGSLILLVKLVYDTRRVGESGAPLVRLPMQIDWPSLLVALLLAVGCYYIVQQFVFPPTVVAGVLGIGSGLGAAAVIEIVLREKLDLCENGVVLVRWPFLPWARIRVLKWDRDGRGALLLRSGWRRIKGKVPAEHREVVDRVLREKLACTGGGDSSLRSE